LAIDFISKSTYFSSSHVWILFFFISCIKLECATIDPWREWDWGHLACVRTFPSKSNGTTFYCLQTPTKKTLLTPSIDFIVPKSPPLRQYQHLLMCPCVGPKYIKPSIKITIINTIGVKVGLILEFLRKSKFGLWMNHFLVFKWIFEKQNSLWIQ
jgi:hypothetical protein